MSEQVLITKEKLNNVANKVLDITGETSGKTLDELNTTLTNVNNEITTQEELIAQLQAAVDNLPEAGGGSITYEEYAGEFEGNAEIIPEGYKVTFGIVNSAPGFNFYSLDNGITWLDFETLGSESTITAVEYIMENVTTIKFKVISTATSGWSGWIKCDISPMIFSIAGENDEVIETDNYILTEDINAVTVTRYLWD